MKIILQVSEEELKARDLSVSEIEYYVGNYLENASVDFPDFIVETIIQEPECDHDWVAKWAHSDCKKCGSVNLGTSRQDKEDYGVAAGKVFKGMADAKFYQSHGITPEQLI